mgnify:CR=1 FL=1
MKKKILLTGSRGVLGSSFKKKNFLKKFKKKYSFIFSDSTKCDLRDYYKTFKYIKKLKPDYIINLAAVSGGIGLSAKYQATLLRDNLLINLNILEVSRKLNIKKLIMTLTTGAYPKNLKLPYKEKNLHDGLPLENNYGSSFAKRIIDPAIKSYRDEFNLDVIGLAPSGIYGENDNFNLDDAPMLPATIHKAFLAKKYKNKLVIWGNGESYRELTYADDYRDIFIWALENYSNSQILNVSSKEEYKIKTIVKKIAKIFKLNSKNLYFDKKKPNGIYKKTCDTSLLMKQKKFNFTKLDVGLKKTIKWFVKNYQNNKIKSNRKIKN